MKKLVLTIILVLSFVSYANAQNDTIMTVAQIYEYVNSFYLDPRICANRYDRVLIYVPSGCEDYCWVVNNELYCDVNPIILDCNTPAYYYLEFGGCGYSGFLFGIEIIEPTVPNPITTTLWKRYGEMLTLEPIDVGSPEMYEFYWSTGENSSSIEVSEPGVYTCVISDLCDSSVQTFIVHDNVEIYRSTVDLATNLNKVTWQVTEEQAGYINQVKVERDGFVVGTTPYQVGQFLDAIGSENAARNYRLTGILYDGTECPIPSYQKGTTHVDYSPNANNPSKLNLAWTPPYIEEGAPVSIAYFQICKYSPETDEITVIDQIGANNTIASYSNNLFEGGYAVLGVLFNESKDNENVSFSNLSEEVLGVGENAENQFKVYPNPSNGVVTIEGIGHLTVMNLLGQEILTQEIEGKTTLELPKGVYFLRLGSAIRKVVVE